MRTSRRDESMEAVFCQWLTKQLQSIYDAVAREPVPAELVVPATIRRPRGGRRPHAWRATRGG